MASVKISELTSTATVSANDLLVVVTDPSGSPATKKVTFGNITNTVYSNVTSSVLPYSNTNLNLGSLTKSWNGVYAKTLYANGAAGSSGQVLFSNGTASYWGNTFTANASNWSNTAPTTLSQAIDRLAILLKSLNGGTGA